jgi:hypothetical protein
MVELKEQELDLGILTDWCLWDGHEATDWQLTEWEIEWLPELVMQDTIRYDYNQWKQNWSKASCTIFSAMGAISDLWNYEFSLDELYEVNELSYSRWRVRGKGWYTKDAVKLACDWWNEKHPDKSVAYYSIASSDDDKANAILNKNYDLNISFNYTADYAKDAEDWVIDRAERWQVLVWHAVCQIIKNWFKYVKDNYKWSKSQYYRINVTNNELWKAWILHNYSYVITKVGENNLSELKRFEKVKTAALNALEANSALRHETNSQEVKDKLHETNEKIRNIILKYIEEKTKELRIL